MAASRSTVSLVVSVLCFIVAGVDAAHVGVDVFTPLAFTEFGVAAYVASKI